MDSSYYDRNGKIINYYSLFKIPSTASDREVKTAFRKLIRLYHPDTTKLTGEDLPGKLDFIINAYRILGDRGSREAYDMALGTMSGTVEEKIPVVPKKRVHYSASLERMLKSRMRPGNMKRKDLLASFGQDIEIRITGSEALKGALAFVELPSRMICPLCSGMDPQCYICRGVGRIHAVSQLRVSIPPGVESGTVIEADLRKLRPNRHTSFRRRSVTIRITVMGEPLRR